MLRTHTAAAGTTGSAAICLPARHPARAHRVQTLADRAAFDTLSATLAAQCRRAGEPLTMLCLVIDAGTESGLDATTLHPLVADVAERLIRCVRRTDQLVHHGGLRFSGLLPGAAEAAAMAVGERLRYACSGPYQLTDRLLTVRLWVDVQVLVSPPGSAAPAPPSAASATHR